jgi:hypothetical protein
MFYLLSASSSQLTIGSIDAMDFGAETCGRPPDFRPLRKAAWAPITSGGTHEQICDAAFDIGHIRDGADGGSDGNTSQSRDW